MLNAIPYLKRSAGLLPHAPPLGLGHYYAKELTKPYYNTDRDVTYDNWFTSVPLAPDLLESRGFISFGKIRHRKAKFAQN